MWQGAHVAVVVPAFREARLIGPTLAGIPDWVDTIVVVDDGSGDHTYERATETGRANVLCVRHEQNRGVGAAIGTGYKVALAQRADVICVMAGDNQMHPEDLPAVIGPVVRAHADYVKGNRLTHPLYQRMPRSRRVGTRALAFLTRLCTGLAVGDTQCGYTAISAKALGCLPVNGLWPRYGYPNDLLGMLASRGLSVLEVPVRPVYASEKSGLHPGHVLSIAWVIARRWQLERRRIEPDTTLQRRQPTTMDSPT
jgi:glycosyltransferase involved in cell wall biosynthesis